MNSDNGSNSLLVPVDLSDSSSQLILAAADLGQRLSASIVVLHVVHESAKHKPYPRDQSGFSVSTRLDDIASSMLERLLDDLSQRHPSLASDAVRTRVVSGVPGNRICEVAEQERPLMIVLGAHQQRKLAHWLCGSTSDHVARNARFPVIQVRAREATDLQSPSHFRNRAEAEPHLFV